MVQPFIALIVISFMLKIDCWYYITCFNSIANLSQSDPFRKIGESAIKLHSQTPAIPVSTFYKLVSFIKVGNLHIIAIPQ